jgi:hypothetical protein
MQELIKNLRIIIKNLELTLLIIKLKKQLKNAGANNEIKTIKKHA